jgi:hypothetical protein
VSRYLYHGEASAANGILSGPTQEIIEVQASCSLPVIGGTAKAHIQKFSHNGAGGNVLSFEHGHTQALGYYVEKDQAWNTIVTATVEGLNILDVVTAKKVVARLASEHPIRGGKPCIRAIGSTFEGLRIAGMDVEVDLATDHLDRYAVHEDLLGAYHGKDTVFRELFDKLRRRDFGAPHETPELIGCTLVRGIECHSDQVTFEDGVVVIPNFGKMHLAELIIKPYERSLTMIRVELGSPPSGSVTVASGRTNGSPTGGGH